VYKFTELCEGPKTKAADNEEAKEYVEIFRLADKGSCRELERRS
jgi:hypothetical protein